MRRPCDAQARFLSLSGFATKGTAQCASVVATWLQANPSADIAGLANQPMFQAILCFRENSRKLRFLRPLRSNADRRVDLFVFPESACTKVVADCRVSSLRCGLQASNGDGQLPLRLRHRS